MGDQYPHPDRHTQLSGRVKLRHPLVTVHSRGIALRTMTSHRLRAGRWQLRGHGGERSDGSRSEPSEADDRVLPTLGHLPIGMLTAGLIRRAIDDWELSHGWSTVKNTVAALVLVLDEAVRDRWMTRNPRQRSRLTTEPRGSRHGRRPRQPQRFPPPCRRTVSGRTPKRALTCRNRSGPLTVGLTGLEPATPWR